MLRGVGLPWTCRTALIEAASSGVVTKNKKLKEKKNIQKKIKKKEKREKKQKNAKKNEKEREKKKEKEKTNKKNVGNTATRLSEFTTTLDKL